MKFLINETSPAISVFNGLMTEGPASEPLPGGKDALFLIIFCVILYSNLIFMMWQSIFSHAYRS